MKNLLNESMADRIFRIVLGIVLLYLGFAGVVTGGLGLAFKIIGFLPLVTGLVGWCPAYTMFKFSTKK
ncbi:MAG: DUF2892 domain-containing protein [Anaerolineales bacterium]|nr:DUF2892 domain-containing protein [Anaerolineales bacterium]